jgi:shikimate dehydrogenase
MRCAQHSNKEEALAASNHAGHACHASHLDWDEQTALSVPMHRCAVLGKPIAHSLSPVLHNAAYRALNLDGWQYGREEVGQQELEAFLSSLDGTWEGLSLTMPLKKTIMLHGTPCDHWSRELGLANTAVFRGRPDVHVAAQAAPANIAAYCVAPSGIALYNTDVDGIVLAFRHAWEAKGRKALPTIGDGPARVVILGNGSTALSALAACLVMREEAAHVAITVVARHPDANAGIAQFCAQHADEIDLGMLSMLGADLGAVAGRMAGADVVISTLPAHAADAIAQRLGAQRAAAAVHGTLLDVSYDPRPTALQRAWMHAGGMSIGGEEMLLYQAIVQVCLMTGRDASRWRVAEQDAGNFAARGETQQGAAQQMPKQSMASENAIAGCLRDVGDDDNAGDIDDVRLEQSMRAALQEAW